MDHPEIQKAWQFYNQWRKEETFCPALNSKIIISRRGWNHIMKNERPLKEKIERAKILELAKDIIKNTTTVQDVRINKDLSFIAFEHIFDLFEKEKIRVIIETRDFRRYRFLSVMKRKI